MKNLILWFIDKQAKCDTGRTNRFVQKSPPFSSSWHNTGCSQVNVLSHQCLGIDLHFLGDVQAFFVKQLWFGDKKKNWEKRTSNKASKNLIMTEFNSISISPPTWSLLMLGEVYICSVWRSPASNSCLTRQMANWHWLGWQISRLSARQRWVHRSRWWAWFHHPLTPTCTGGFPPLLPDSLELLIPVLETIVGQLPDVHLGDFHVEIPPHSILEQVGPQSVDLWLLHNEKIRIPKI